MEFSAPLDPPQIFFDDGRCSTRDRSKVEGEIHARTDADVGGASLVPDAGTAGTRCTPDAARPSSPQACAERTRDRGHACLVRLGLEDGCSSVRLYLGRHDQHAHHPYSAEVRGGRTQRSDEGRSVRSGAPGRSYSPVRMVTVGSYQLRRAGRVERAKPGGTTTSVGPRVCTDECPSPSTAESRPPRRMSRTFSTPA